MREVPTKVQPAQPRPQLSQEARELGVEVSRLTELGPEAAMRMVHMRRRQKENADAIEAYNRFIDEHGIPFEEQRKF
jgi:antitoxin CcdA